MRINTNTQAIAAQRSLNLNHEAQNRSLEKLSSGSRIVRAADDAAGLAISEKLKAHIRSMRQAERNANDGISLVQVAEGGMNEVGNILTRMRELSIQSASDTIGDTERGFINKEIKGLKEEIDRIALSTEFNGRKLLDGNAEALDIQVGIKNNDFEDRFKFNAKNLTSTLDALGLTQIDNATKEASQQNLEMLDKAITRINENRSELGALQNRLQSTINNLGIYRENLSAANSRIRDTDVAEETSELMKNNILTQATVSVLGQANQNSQVALKLLG
ncbi:MAG: flagellin FliC [Bdellovibrionales bacterium]|nr:flagellin FliC [Bdellovibrionales bacterium]